MSKTIEEIREEVAKENAFDDWEDLCFCHGEMTSIKRFEELTNFSDEVAQRYAQSQTQELTKQYEDLELSNTLLKDQIIHLQNDLGYRKILLEQRVEQNRELVETIWYLYNFSKGMHFHEGSKTDKEISELLSKYHHLNKKP